MKGVVLLCLCCGSEFDVMRNCKRIVRRLNA